MSKVPKGCDQQGRHPEAAEAATEVGNEEPNFYSAQYMLEEFGFIVVGAVIVVALIVAVACFVGKLL